MKLIVLAAGATNTTDAYADPPPKCLRRFDDESTVLDRIVSAGNRAGCSQVAIVGGYQILSIMQAYPQFSYYYNPRWEETGSLASLLYAAGEGDDDLLIAYSDVVFDPEHTAALAADHGDLVVATDSNWTTRYEGRTAAHRAEAEKLFRLQDGSLRVARRSVPAGGVLLGEFAGIFALRAQLVQNAFARATQLADADPMAGVDALIADLSDRLPAGSATVHDFEGAWAELDSEQDIARFRFGTKAETLERLRGQLSTARILPQHTLMVGDWRRDPDAACAAVAARFGDQHVVVRSSALNEDSEHASMAGSYESVLNVPVADDAALRAAIDRVADSYSKDSDDLANQILIQPMLDSVSLSGVAFTADLETSAPYFIINYDTSGSTESITSGEGSGAAGQQRSVVIHKASDVLPADPRLAALVGTLREIEKVTGFSSLDVEFAVREVDAGAPGANGAPSSEVVIFQVRPIAAHKDQLRVSAADVGHELAHVARFLTHDAADRTSLSGDRTAWGIMPDWNPAEIIGINPRPLAFSLYRHVITDQVWGQSREACGYRSTRPRPGIVDLAGKPYVDIRMSFSSFTPATLPDELADRLVSAAVEHVVANPHLHDKVEFQVMPTAWDPDFSARVQHLVDAAGLGPADLEAVRLAYQRLSASIIAGDGISVSGELERVGLLDPRRKAVMESVGAGDMSAAAAIAVLLDDCRAYGTLPFSNLARFAFVGVVQLKALVARKLLSQARVDAFLASIETVAKEFVGDLANASRSNLIARYGHLRPGTYDITSPAYHEAFDQYVDLGSRPAAEPLIPFALSDTERSLIDAELAAARLVDARGKQINAERLFQFIREAVQGREAGKFAFSRNLSAAIDLAAQIAAREGVSRDDASFLDIDRFLALSGASRPAGLASEWRAVIERRRRRHRVTSAIRLPPVIGRIEDIQCFEVSDERPNFVTQQVVQGRPHRVAGVDQDIQGAIVLIENADPGFDWIFSHGIAALVTKFGGANSHMAIRCAEFGIPAAIGCGDAIFGRVERAHVVRLDCAAQRLEVIR